jgi:hypothetical protein
LTTNANVSMLVQYIHKLNVAIIVVALASVGRIWHSMVLLTMLKVISLDNFIKDGSF